MYIVSEKITTKNSSKCGAQLSIERSCDFIALHDPSVEF